MKTMTKEYQPKTGVRCTCKKGVQRDNCGACEGTGWQIDFAAIRARTAEPQRMAPPSQFGYYAQAETRQAHAPIHIGTVSHSAVLRGWKAGEPLLVCMDALIRYAKAHKARFESPLADDGVLGAPWLDAAKGIRALLNGDGAVAHELGVTTDSKDNGAIEAMFWSALSIAGYTEADL